MKRIVLFLLMTCFCVIYNSFGDCSLASVSDSRYAEDVILFNINDRRGLACNRMINGTCLNGNYALIKGRVLLNGEYKGTDDGWVLFKCEKGLFHDKWNMQDDVDGDWLGECKTEHGGYVDFVDDFKGTDGNLYSIKVEVKRISSDKVYWAGSPRSICKELKSKAKDEKNCEAGRSKIKNPHTVPDAICGNSAAKLKAGVCYPDRYLNCLDNKEACWEGDIETGQCRCKDNNKQWKNNNCIGKVEPQPNPIPAPSKKCEDGRTTEEGKACCHFNKSVADWDDVTQKCICADKSAEFKKVDGVWRCVSVVGVCDSFRNNPEAYACCDAGYIWENGKCNGCPDGQRWYWNAKQNKGMCTDVPDDSAKVEDAKRTISDFFAMADLDKSVWKDAEGNFNTARLASDLTAGVVLGTVGGVVSGVVIKKKQVEKGFDALHCTIGGQTVADWGDLFNVGLRR